MKTNRIVAEFFVDHGVVLNAMDCSRSKTFFPTLPLRFSFLHVDLVILKKADGNTVDWAICTIFLYKGVTKCL